VTPYTVRDPQVRSTAGGIHCPPSCTESQMVEDLEDLMSICRVIAHAVEKYIILPLGATAEQPPHLPHFFI
jgi:hypothetical protein